MPSANSSGKEKKTHFLFTHVIAQWGRDSEADNTLLQCLNRNLIVKLLSDMFMKLFVNVALMSLGNGSWPDVKQL